MLQALLDFFNSSKFMPHGYCFVWQPDILWLHVLSNIGIAAAYYSIPLVLFYFVRKRKDLPFQNVFLLFGAFILLCGTTHLMGIWVLWHADYALEGVIMALTAIASIGTLFVTVKLIPQALLLPSPKQLAAINEELQESNRKLEALYKESKESGRAYLRAVLDNVLDGLITIDERGTVESMNPAGERIFGYASEEVVGRNIKMLMPEPYHSEHDDYLSHYIATGNPKIIGTAGREVRAKRKDGSVFPIDLSVSSFQLEGKRHFSGIVRDITARKQAEEALRDADRKKDQFLATLSHELRNPLAPLSNALDVLGLPDLDAERYGKAHKIIQHQVQQMVRLVDDLLDVSRITHGKVQIHKERITLNQVINSALETARPLTEAGGHTVTVHLPEKPIHLDADLTRLSQIFVNLLNNAAKYTPKGGRIWLEAAEEDNMVVVRVRDTGIGIPADMLSQIFNMFTQVDSSIERTHGGLGIGLMLVKSLAELHGGSVGANSKGINQGSEFVVRLPLAMPNQSAGVSSTSPEPAPEKTPGKLKVLVVDDNKTSAETLGWMVESLGHEVQLAYEGMAALAAARVFLPDVILLDIGLPAMSGYEVCKLMRAEPVLKHSLLVAQSGWGQAEDRRRSKEVGFDHHFIKPVRLQTLEDLFLSLGTTPRQ